MSFLTLRSSELWSILVLAICLLSSVSAQPADPALLAARMNCIELLTVRSTSYAQLHLAYQTCASADVTHTVQDVGDFGPGYDLALEYDEIVVIFPLLGQPDPVQLRPVFDRSTIAWLSEDMARVDYIINITLQYNATTGGYNYNMQGFRYSTFYVFSNSSTDHVSLIYDIQDPAAIALFTLGSGIVPASVICESFIFPACNGTPYSGPLPFLPDTGYDTIEECTEFIASVQAPSKCPFQGRSNTAACRTTHSWAAFIRPDIHCSHVSPSNSVCEDGCYPACDDCDVNAECAAIFSSTFTPEYKCQCKDGYTGDGKTCTPVTCDRRSAPSGASLCRERHTSCVNSTCVCNPTFTWNATSRKCECIGGSVWGALCVPTGRCTTKRQCAIQRANTVSCSTYGYNPLTDWKHCLCNYGYEGGWEYPCTCLPGRREVHSSQSGGGQLCIGSGECVRRHDCGRDHSCKMRGDGSGVGDCVHV